MLLNANCGNVWEPGTDLFSVPRLPVDDLIVRHELNSRKQFCVRLFVVSRASPAVKIRIYRSTLKLAPHL